MKVRFNVKRYFQVLGISLAVIIAVTAVCMGIWDSSDSQELVDNTSTVAVADGKINVLIMAVDVDGLRTDAMMLASFDTETKQVNMLSIPRDTRIYVGNRYQKINAAHAYATDGKIGGPTAACEAVTRITGIPINYYVDFSFDAVAHVVNELGPIEFEIPDLYGDGVGMVYDDPVQSLHINLPPGKYGSGSDCDYPGINGQQAVWLMRYRHGNKGTKGAEGYPNGDLGRVEMQQEFIKAVVDQKLNASMILKIPSIFKTISSEIKTNFTVNDVIKYSKYLSDFSSGNIHSYELPGEFDTYIMDGYEADVWEADLDGIRELVQTVFGYPADDIMIGNPNNSGSDDESSQKKSSSGSSAGSSSSSGGSSKSSSGNGSSGSSSSSGTSSSSGSTKSGDSSSSSGSKSESKISYDDEDEDVSGNYGYNDEDDYSEDDYSNDDYYEEDE